jgi:hypothetical protein
MTETTETAEAVTEDTTLADGASQEQELQDENTIGDDAPAGADEPEGEGEQPPAKPKKSAQERINELTAKQREAEREAEYWKAKATQAPQSEPAKPQPAAEADAEPDPANYTYGETDSAYIRDVVDYRVREGLRNYAQEQQQKTTAQTIAQTWQSRVAEFASKTPDFEAVAYSDTPMTAAMERSIVTSDVGPAVAYYLGKNPIEARRIAALNDPIAEARELGRIEARLSTPAQTPAKTASDAPAPIAGVRGINGKFSVAPDTKDFAAFERLADQKG